MGLEPRTLGVTLNGLNNVPIGFPLQRSAKEGRYGLAVTSYSYLHGVRRTNRRPWSSLQRYLRNYYEPSRLEAMRLMLRFGLSR